MKNPIIYLSILILFSFYPDVSGQSWFKGNTHMHTDFSDGDSPIKEVVDWYHDHGYNFISITDHNKTTIPLDHISRNGFRDDFIMIIGNEITSSVHFTALGVKRNFSVKSIIEDYEQGKLKGYDLPDADTTKTGHSQVLINGMLKEGALVFINHPNFSTGISAEEMLQLKGAIAIELANAHPSVNNYGNDNHIPVEEKWDYLLSNGMQVYGVGSDDEHHIKKWGPRAANPGRSWIMVRADKLDNEHILKSIETGDFYSSSGVELSGYEVEENEVSVEIDAKKTKQILKNKLGVPRITDEGEKGFRIAVIGKNGTVLKTANELALNYPLSDIDGYIRFRAEYTIKKKGKFHTYYAWLQPIFKN